MTKQTFVQGGDGGIYVGSIMKGGAVALDGRIEPGDMILQVLLDIFCRAATFLTRYISTSV